MFTSTVRCSIGAHSAWLSAFVITYDFCFYLPTFFLQVATLLAFISIAAMTAPASPVTPKEHIRDPQPLKDSLAFVYDTDVHQLSSFIRSGPPLGRTKLMLALGLSFQAPGSRISGPPAPEGSIPPKEKEKGEKVEKKVEEDPPSIHKDIDKSDKSHFVQGHAERCDPPGAGPSIPGDAASASAADPSIATPPPTTLPSVRKPNIDPVADPAFLEQKPEGTACRAPPGRLLAAESLAVAAMACVATAVRFHSTPTLRASTPYICAKGALEPRGRPSPLHLIRKTAMRSGTTTPGTNPGAEDGPGQGRSQGWMTAFSTKYLHVIFRILGCPKCFWLTFSICLHSHFACLRSAISPPSALTASFSLSWPFKSPRLIQVYAVPTSQRCNRLTKRLGSPFVT